MNSKPKCPHIIRTNKYERNAPEVTDWWHKLFASIESDASIPPDKRLDVVQEIFPDKLFKKILTILTFIRVCKPSKDDDDSGEKKNGSEETSSKKVLIHFKTEAEREEIGSINPYVRFLKRRPDRAAIWHTLPPLSLEEISLLQKAEAITKAIATDFVKWMEEISDEDSPTSLTIPLVLKMFEIGFNTHAAKSLQVRMKEMASVPDGVALLKGVPEMAKRSQLRQQIFRDMKVSTAKKKLFAFGTKLDSDFRVLPSECANIQKWLVCKRIPSDLDSMAAVWQGITHLRSTKAYCEYLLNHPEITPPKFLVDMKMLNEAALET